MSEGRREPGRDGAGGAGPTSGGVGPVLSGDIARTESTDIQGPNAVRADGADAARRAGAAQELETALALLEKVSGGGGWIYRSDPARIGTSAAFRALLALDAPGCDARGPDETGSGHGARPENPGARDSGNDQAEAASRYAAERGVRPGVDQPRLDPSDFNAPTAALFDAPSEVPAEVLLEQVAPADRARLLSRLRRALRRGAPAQTEISLMPGLGGRRLRVHAEPAMIDARPVLVGVVIDISERSQLLGGLGEAALEALRAASLVGESRPRAMRPQAPPPPVGPPESPPAVMSGQGDRDGERFISAREIDKLAHVAAHDLQAPLRKILFYADLVKRAYAQASETKAAAMPAAGEETPALDWLDVIIASANRMRMQLSGLSRFADIAATPLEMRDTLLSELVRHAVSETGAATGAGAARLRIDADAPIYGDPGLLSEALSGMIALALDARPENGHDIRVAAAPALQQAHTRRITLSVAREERAPRPFASGSGGGVRLAICAEIARRHGGRAWAEPRENGAELFHLELPLAPEASTPTTPGEAPAQPRSDHALLDSIRSVSSGPDTTH